MNSFDYPPIIPGEMLFSYINRYYIFTGNNSYQKTISYLLNSTRKCYSLHYINDINGVLDNINLTRYEYVDKHTLLPLLKLVLPLKEYEVQIYKILSSKSSMHEPLKRYDIFNVSSNKIGYCPLCMIEYQNQTVFMCYHQTTIDVCYKHNVKLNYLVRTDRRRDFIITNKDINYHYCINNDMDKYHLMKDIYDLLKLSNRVDCYRINERIKLKLKNLGIFKHNRFFSSNLVFNNSLNRYKHSIRYIMDLKSSNINYIEYLMLIDDLFGSASLLLESL